MSTLVTVIAKKALSDRSTALFCVPELLDI
jgi:hypothetical protein